MIFELSEEEDPNQKFFFRVNLTNVENDNLIKYHSIIFFMMIQIASGCFGQNDCNLIHDRNDCLRKI